MCLRLAAPKSIPNFIDGKLKCYKLLRPEGSFFATAFMDVICGVPGPLTSGRPKQLIQYEKESCTVGIGIHVFINAVDAFKESKRLGKSGIKSYQNLVVVECEAFEQDFVTFGVNDISCDESLYSDGAVFVKVNLVKVITEGEQSVV